MNGASTKLIKSKAGNNPIVTTHYHHSANPQLATKTIHIAFIILGCNLKISSFATNQM
jgi:hypothetical protein